MRQAPDRLTYVWLIPIALACALGGCAAKALQRTAADDYRDRIRALEDEVEALAAANAELRASLAELSRTAGPPPADVPEVGGTWNAADVMADTPRAVRLAIGWGSSVERTATPGLGELTLYVEPRDALGRFVQVAGYVDIRAVAVRDPGRGETVTVAEARLTPRALRESWRSGAFGSHYTLTLPVDLAAATDATTFAIAIVLYDGIEARRLAAHTTLELAGPQPPP